MQYLKFLIFSLFILIIASGIYLSTAATQPSQIGFNDQTDFIATVDFDTLKPSSDTIIQKAENLKDSTYVFYQKGEASWYADPNHKLDRYNGRKTASGLKMDTYQFWAAHRSLPFGSIVRVIKGEDTVIVKIVDRGPFAHNRIIDLSWAAAQKINMAGCSKVVIERLMVDGKPLVEAIK